MNSPNSRRAWPRRSCPSRSRVRSTSDEIENPISPPNAAAYSVVRLCIPTMWLSKRLAISGAASRTGTASPSPTTASKFFIPNSSARSSSSILGVAQRRVTLDAIIRHRLFFGGELEARKDPWPLSRRQEKCDAIVAVLGHGASTGRRSLTPAARPPVRCRRHWPWRKSPGDLPLRLFDALEGQASPPPDWPTETSSVGGCRRQGGRTPRIYGSFFAGTDPPA